MELSVMEKKADQLSRRAEALRREAEAMAREASDFPAVERNLKRLLSCVKMIELNLESGDD